MATTLSERRQLDRQARRRKIQRVARRIFSERGFAGTTIEEIARRAGLSVGAIYLYFKSKEDLYVSLLQDSLDQLAVELEHILVPPGDARAQLRAAWELLSALGPTFREFLRIFPTHERAADALFYIGESWAGESADSAAAVYQQVVKTYPNSSRAPSALYKLGLLAEQRGDKAAARTYYARVVAGYPRSDEANLARDKLQRLGR